jgi:hypothetical protein
MIVVGEAVVQGGKVVITPPTLGFGAVRAVRLTNYTANVLIVSNISGIDQSQEYLLPLQQMVYESLNTSGVPSISVKDIGAAISAPPTVLVEWSTDPLPDFPGTYPTTIGEPSGAPYLYADSGLIQQDTGISFNYMSIGQNPFRTSLTIVNNNYGAGFDGIVSWYGGTVPPSSALAGAVIPAGGGRTINSTAPVYVGVRGTDAATATLEIVEESWGAQSPLVFNWTV